MGSAASRDGQGCLAEVGEKCISVVRFKGYRSVIVDPWLDSIDWKEAGLQSLFM